MVQLFTGYSLNLCRALLCKPASCAENDKILEIDSTLCTRFNNEKVFAQFAPENSTEE